MPSAELIGLEAPKKAHRSLVFALAAPCRQIESAAEIRTSIGRGIGFQPVGAARHLAWPLGLDRLGEKFGMLQARRLDCAGYERLA